MSDSTSLQFYGGAGTVTGSKYLIRVGRRQVLLECGLFQGLKALRLRNWGNPPFQVSRLDAVVLSHAHIDHSGYLPRIVRAGFRGKVFCTSGTADLLRILLPDAAHLQEEEAAFANKHGYSKHKPALPLYTAEDADTALKHLRPSPYSKPLKVVDGVMAVFRRAGHILGSATVELQLGDQRPTSLLFSGDLGRWSQPLLRAPEMAPGADILLLESTYGDRAHAQDPEVELARIVNDAVQRGGALVIPAFAVGRTQVLIWTLRRLEESGKIPSLPVYIDSPMANNVSDLYCRHPEDHSLDMTELMDAKRCPLCCRQYHVVRLPAESKALNHVNGPCIIVSASGMATGGRVLHHLKLRLPDPRTTVLLVGYQAAGTRGRSLQEGATRIRIHGIDVPIRAHVETLDGFSAHADQQELFRWLSGLTHKPRQVYLVHGEPQAAAKLADAIRATFSWQVTVARDGETVELSH